MYIYIYIHTYIHIHIHIHIYICIYIYICVYVCESVFMHKDSVFSFKGRKQRDSRKQGLQDPDRFRGRLGRLSLPKLDAELRATLLMIQILHDTTHAMLSLLQGPWYNEISQGPRFPAWQRSDVPGSDWACCRYRGPLSRRPDPCACRLNSWKAPVPFSLDYSPKRSKVPTCGVSMVSRNRNYGLGKIPDIWVLGPSGSRAATTILGSGR